VKNVEKNYVHIPHSLTPPEGKLVKRALMGCGLSPAYWVMAHACGVPGLQFHRFCTTLGLRLLFQPSGLSMRMIYRMMFAPMDSVRYFEFGFMWRAMKSSRFAGRYLDVSSARFFPIILLDRNRAVTAELVNPDNKDIEITRKLVERLKLTTRCQLHNCPIEEAPFAPESFDTITSISVVEHIPGDTRAVRKMWEVLKPGGTLLLSVPCAAKASEEYVDFNEYGLLAPDETGFVLGQRFYDEESLQERIFCITGEPVRYAVYGEKEPGFLFRNREKKCSDCTYPFWREPYMMGQECRYFNSVSHLPGWGVIAMQFAKL
jgi:SAM-dependent methyltransferase